MSERRSTRRKPTAFIVGMMVLLATVFPTAGALANHGNADVASLALSPATDSAQVNTCNEFVVTATAQQGGQSRAAEGETIDIRAVQSDGDTARDLQINFCNPGTTGSTGLGGETDCDDDAGFTAAQQNLGACPAGTPPVGNENPAQINGQCTTVQVSDTAAECRFGVMSDEPGTMDLIAYVDQNNNNIFDAGDTPASNTAQKTWQTSATASGISCTPTTDANPEGSRHEFRCTVTDPSGNPVPNVQVSFDVTAGPNAEEVGPTNCGAAQNTVTGGTPTNAQGQTAAPAAEQPGGGQNPALVGAACGYNDAGTFASPPGTDTITAYINVTQAGATAGPDAGEAQTTISKSWFGNLRTIDCEPETASNPGDSTHLVTCTARDAGGQPVQGAEVDVFESGPGDVTFITSQGGPCPGGTAAGAVGCGVTDSSGQVRITTFAERNVTGTQNISGDITLSPTTPGGATNQCSRPAGDPTGAPAGVCRDDVTKTWTGPQTQTPPPTDRTFECEDGADNDGDGRTDFPDDPDCTNPEDTSEADIGGRFNTTLTFRYDANDNPPKFKGAVASQRNECTQNRTVRIKKQKRGRDRTIATTQSNRRGNFKAVKRRIRRGRYYAVTNKVTKQSASGATLVCLRDRSVTVKLRRNR